MSILVRMAVRDAWSESDVPTRDMVRFFYDRTGKHVDRVVRNLERMGHEFPELDGPELEFRAERHDETKYHSPCLLPYIWLTEFHRRGQDDSIYPPGMKERVHAATEYHVKNETHHPEALGEENMSPEDLAEMVADWHAMSQEVGGSTRSWADKNMARRWKFSPEQQELVYNMIEVLESGDRERSQFVVE